MDEKRWRRRIERYRRRIEILEGVVEERTRDLYLANERLHTASHRIDSHVAARTADLTRQLEEAVALGQAKTDFVARMSHELRTPLHGVLGMLELVADTSLDTQQLQWLQSAMGAGRHLMSVIGDILDFSKLASGEFSVEMLPVDVSQLVEQAAKTLESLAEPRSNRLTYSVPHPRLPPVLMDPVRFRQVVTNLVSNALKFTDQGHVSLSLAGHVLGREVHLTLEVRDTGVGIPQERLAHLFQPFVQADASTTRQYGGSGLGLTICREIIEQMGGRIEVRSAVGEGSTFIVTLTPEIAPVHPEAQPALPEGPSVDGLVVVVADDQSLNREIARGMLEGLGVSVEEATNGQEAVEQVMRMAPDIVLMDCHMPVMDGLMATRALRERGFAGPIVAVTADVSAENQERVRAAGMQGLLGKPYTFDDLDRMVRAQRPALEPVLDVARLVRDVGGDRALAERLLGTFADTLQDLVRGVHSAIDGGEPGRLAEHAHALKGSAASVRARSLQQVAASLEKAGSDGVVPATAGPGLDRAVQQVREALHDHTSTPVPTG